jgi:competence protein ComEC
MRGKRFFKGIMFVLCFMLSVSFINVKLVHAEQGDAEDLTNYALNIKTFYNFNMAYAKIMQLSDVNQRNQLLVKLDTITKEIWTPEVTKAVAMLGQVCDLKDGKTYSDTEVYLGGLAETNMDKMTQGYLLGELTSWGRAFVYTSDYIAGVDAVVKAWQTKIGSDITTAEITIESVKNQKSKDYLLGELRNLNVLLNQGNLKVHYINVGQADSILVQQGNNYMLVDAGNNEDAQVIKNYLDEQNVSELQYFVGTHKDEDHIGSADYVINSFKVGKVYFPKQTATTRTFEDFVIAVKNKGLQLTVPTVGESFKLGDATITVLAPNSATYTDANDYSIVLKVQYGNTSFLLTGDAEAVSESEMLSKGLDLSATVLKVGHHGSRSSTSQNFLNKVNPKYAVISVGIGNTYGHPTQDVMDRLKAKSIPVYRTDENGTIVATSDGNNVTFSTQPGSYSGVVSELLNSNNSTPTPTPIPTPTPTPSTDEKQYVDVDGNGLIKGNISSTGEKIYHMPGGAYYNRTIAEVYFKTETEAQAAGFRKSSR